MKILYKIILVIIFIIITIFLPFPLVDNERCCTKLQNTHEYTTIYIAVVGYDEVEHHINDTPDLINVSRGTCESLGYGCWVWDEIGEDCYGSHSIVVRRHSFDIY